MVRKKNHTYPVRQWNRLLSLESGSAARVIRSIPSGRPIRILVTVVQSDFQKGARFMTYS